MKDATANSTAGALGFVPLGFNRTDAIIARCMADAFQSVRYVNLTGNNTGSCCCKPTGMEEYYD